MKTSTLNESNANPTVPEPQTTPRITGQPHLQVIGNGTHTANVYVGQTLPAVVRDVPNSETSLDLHTIKVTWQKGVSGDLRVTTLGKFLDAIEQEKSGQEVKAIRSRYASTLKETGDAKQAKDMVGELKKELPCITPSGLFDERRKRECLFQYSRIICYDIDHADPAPILAAARNCPFILAGFSSPTDTGAKLFVRVDAAADASNHLDLWQAGKQMVKKYFDMDVDESRKDITGLCFISAGPVYRNLHAKPVTLGEFPPPKPEGRVQRNGKQLHRAELEAKPVVARTDESAGDHAGGKPRFKLDPSLAPEDTIEARKVVAALQYVDPSPENIWREVGMALKAQWGDAAWDLFDEWSAQGDGYDEDENEKRWDSFSDEPDAGITLATIFYYAKQGGWKPHDRKAVILPTYSSSAFCCDVYKIISPTHTVFLQGGQAVCIEEINGQPEIVAVDAHKGIRLFEKHIQFLKKQIDKKTDDAVFVPVPLWDRDAKLLVGGVQPGELPELKGVTFCPTLVERTLENGDEVLTVAKPGYIPETGWFNASPLKIALPPLAEAVKQIKWLYREFDFPTPGDRSRALVYPIGVALKLSGLIKGFVPMDFGTANDQQSGKGTRQRMTAALFNRSMEIITQSDGHIGGTSEMFKSACLAGRMFIQLDNFDHFHCREMEAFLTGQNVRMRDAYGRPRSIDPANFFTFLSSNGLAARRDLALRSWFIRVLKRPEGHQFEKYAEGGVVEHVLANHAIYLGCIFAICAEWWKQFSPRTDETRHNFVDFTQACDWIAQHFLTEAPVMDGHAEAQSQYSDAGRVFFLRLWDVLAKQEKLNRFFRAGQLATMSFRYSIPIPGLHPRSHGDESAGAKLIGSLAADVFDEVEFLNLGQGKIVERKETRPAEFIDDDYLPRPGKPSPCYLFKLGAQEVKVSTSTDDAQTMTEITGVRVDREPQDQLTVFRDNLLAALAEAGKSVPCKVSTQYVASLFAEFSVDSAGRWLSNLAKRYPKRFAKSDTEHGRGWQIQG